jgi:hypothetical protein
VKLTLQQFRGTAFEALELLEVDHGIHVLI